jgi:protein-tyrosine phosphatase
MARAAVAAGTTTLVATPHLDSRWAVRLEDVAERVGDLRAALEGAQIPLDIEVGAEVAANRLRELEDDAAYAMARLGEGPWLLVECPLEVAPSMAFDGAVLELLQAGRPVVLAHPERSPAFQRDERRLGRLVDTGAICSVTAGAFAGRFGGAVQRSALNLLSAGLAHNVASDAHDAVRRAPGLLDGLPGARAGAEPPAHVRWLTADVPAAVLAGEPLPDAPAPLRRRG